MADRPLLQVVLGMQADGISLGLILAADQLNISQLHSVCIIYHQPEYIEYKHMQTLSMSKRFAYQIVCLSPPYVL